MDYISISFQSIVFNRSAAADIANYYQTYGTKKVTPPDKLMNFQPYIAHSSRRLFGIGQL